MKKTLDSTIMFVYSIRMMNKGYTEKVDELVGLVEISDLPEERKEEIKRVIGQEFRSRIRFNDFESRDGRFVDWLKLMELSVLREG